MNLYELSADLVALRDLEEVEASEIIAIVQNEIANKGKGIIQVVRSIEADVDAVKNEIDRLTKIKRAKENHIKKLREYTKSCMEQMNMKKLETPVGNITVRKGTSTLKIDDETKLPDKYLEIVQTYKVNKDLIKADLKAGIEIDGAYMTEPGTTLMIK
ncbi:siphovirus Gp157 family protein [Romboutsia ilealis]|uniref:siphovirus Gp157 family protein n=1 Tax=Romboutsia ilealis TaxID=1115758 RepID=UPI002570F027|nr:siphovirus Gp157 family protein [Romboutsia ilealis]